MHPSDIDAVLEFDNDILILMEVKKQGIEIPVGQKLLLERISQSWHTPRSVVLKVEYLNIFKDDEDVENRVEQDSVNTDVSTDTGYDFDGDG